MGEGECESVPDELPKQPRHRKKHLYNAILKQMEFYFSDSNLSKDRFLSQLLTESNYVDLSVFLKFNKILKLNCTVEDIRKAVKKSELIELSEDGEKVGRKKPVKVKENVDACTIYVENIKSDANHDWLSQVFSEFGRVAYVSIPKYKHNKVNKGFAFVEYETEQEAEDALSFFQSVGLKMPADKDPEQLRSIVTFEDANVADSNSVKKRKISETENETEPETKKTKLDNNEKEEENKPCENKFDNNEAEEEKTEEEKPCEVKKKKKNKKDKKKNHIKELGMQVLSKKEWKRLRNKYLDLQKKKMHEFKQYLHRQKFNQKKVAETVEPVANPLEFVPGVIVKLKLKDPCPDVKKIKADIKAVAPDVKYVDVPKPAGEDFFIRFGSEAAAKEFLTKDLGDDKTILSNEEEETYWKKIQGDRNLKFEKQNRKERGREKLLKKAERESAKHIRFDEID